MLRPKDWVRRLQPVVQRQGVLLCSVFSNHVSSHFSFFFLKFLGLIRCFLFEVNIRAFIRTSISFVLDCIFFFASSRFFCRSLARFSFFIWPICFCALSVSEEACCNLMLQVLLSFSCGTVYERALTLPLGATVYHVLICFLISTVRLWVNKDERRWHWQGSAIACHHFIHSRFRFFRHSWSTSVLVFQVNDWGPTWMLSMWTSVSPLSYRTIEA